MYWKCLYFQDKKEQGQVLPSCTSPSYFVRALGVCLFPYLLFIKKNFKTEYWQVLRTGTFTASMISKMNK